MARNPDLNIRANALIHPIPQAKASYDVLFGSVGSLESQISLLQRDWNLNLNPDFQRGHVWTDAQRRLYIEGIFEQTVTAHQNVIQFNCPHWEREPEPGQSDLPAEMQIVDGLQRLTSLRMFVAGIIKPFGMSYSELLQTDFSPRSPRYSVKFAVHTFQTREQLLSFYLRINAGGTPHSETELERVARLLEESRNKPSSHPRETA